MFKKINYNLFNKNRFTYGSRVCFYSLSW